MKTLSSKSPTNASILVGVLWCLALLAVVVIGVLHTARLDLVVGKNFGDQIQAHYLALAGVEKAKALLYLDSRERSRSHRNHSGELFDSPLQFRDVAYGRGHFRVFRRGRSDEGGGVIYGISDEESRLNLNTVTTNELGKLRGMTPDIVAALLDWRDGDNVATPGGAEAEYYSTLKPPGLPRNGPLLTTRELMMVRGVTPELFLGAIRKPTGAYVGGDDETDDNPGLAIEDMGWSGIVTVHSAVRNVSAGGQDRVNLQTAEEAALTSIKGITAEIARAIIAYRTRQQFGSVADLLDVPPAQSQNPGRPQGGQTSGTQGAQPSNAVGPGERGVVSQELLADIADELTTEDNQNLPGLVNINSASLEVLACLPGVSREIAQAIISQRQSDGYFPSIAGLLKVPGVTREIFKQLAPRVSARSDTFRIISEGKVDSSGARRRIEVIVRVGLQTIETLSYRDGL